LVTVVTGASGQLGTAFGRLLPEAMLLSRRDLDLDRPEHVFDALAVLRPSALINCAAYTAVDAAEANQDEAFRVNAAAVGEMARYASGAAIPFVTFSTDYVFPGDATEPYVESTPTSPINAYGSAKLAGERLALSVNPRSLIVRTSWVISGTHRNFVATMIRLAGERDVVRVVNDQQGRPTVAADLAAAAHTALESEVTGILHLANAGATTWFGLAREAVALAGFDPERIQPCPTTDFPTPARRPAYSVLGTERGGETGVTPLPHWKDSLPRVVAALTGAF